MPQDYGFKVAKEGDSVLTAIDDRLIFSSKFKTLKVLSPGGAGSVSITTDANGDGIQEITHNLGFSPAFIALRKTGTLETVSVSSGPGASADDSFVIYSGPASGNIYNDAVFASFGYGGDGNLRHAGFRFPNVTIPQGSTIVYATITGLAYSTRTETTCRIRIYGEANDDVGQFNTYDNFMSKPLTTAYVSWEPEAFTADILYETPDITSIIQEIVNRAGWVSGNSLIIFFRNNGSDANARRDFKTWDGSFVVATLTVYYQKAATVQNAYFPNVENFNQDIQDFQHSFAYSDANKLYLRMINAAPNTTFTLKYYLFSDLAESYSGAQGGSGDRDWGLKISAFTAAGFDVAAAKPYQLAYSSRFSALKIDNSLVGSGTISLPLLTSGEQSDVLDITHGLGYPPLFLAFVESDVRSIGYKFEVPNAWITVVDSFYIQVWAWCDGTKVRIKAWRYRHPLGSDLPAEVFTIKYYIFREDLSLL